MEILKNHINKSETEFILNNLRYEDKQELICLLGEDWFEKTISLTDEKNTLVLYGNDFRNKKVPIAMGGFYEIDDGSIACVWLLSTIFVIRNKTLLMKTLRNQLLQGIKKYKIMYNFIYKSNFEAKSWLTKLGFNFDNPHPVNINHKDGFEFFYRKT